MLVARDFVAKVTQEKFSKSRTWLTATGLTAAAVAFISSRGLLGFGSEAKTGGGGNKKTD